ncbi:hypothetical protein BJ508DRAFT_313947 [Ascobolus immersus RN42]|uniref:Uncharacterized protein n=1 Tax=Ascobolus immersus RN42 TaxID=1160509 RepID=A0A3N4HGT7_ASCIM|nr:hypothetical protein BJ508DRAFT_313947 [Ascobolus immersus RN42]
MSRRRSALFQMYDTETGCSVWFVSIPDSGSSDQSKSQARTRFLIEVSLTALMSSPPQEHAEQSRRQGSKRARDPNEPELSEVQGLSAFIRYRASKNKAIARARYAHQATNPPNPTSRRAAKRIRNETSNAVDIPGTGHEKEGSVTDPVNNTKQQKLSPPKDSQSNTPPPGPETKEERIARLQAEIAMLQEQDGFLPDAPHAPSRKKVSCKRTSIGNDDIIAYSDEDISDIEEMKKTKV